MSLLRLAVDDLRRGRGRLALAGLAAVMGSAVLTFLLALGTGTRAVVLGEILPLDRLEVTPRRVDLNLLALRVGLGSETLDEKAVAKLASVRGVRRVYPKQVLSVPSVVSGGASLLGSDIAIEVVADGVSPALLEPALRSRFEPRDPAKGGARCAADGECPKGEYCSAQPGGRECRQPIPVLLSPHLVELYNGALHRAYGLPRLNPDFALGTTADLAVGASIIQPSGRRQVIQERARLAGFSDLAIPLGVTMPLEWVRYLNQRQGAGEEAERYQSAILVLDGRSDGARVASAVRELGFDVSDRGAERAATLLTVLMLVFGLFGAAITALAAIGVGHAFLLLTTLRQREIGVLRAVGARASDIRTLFLGEGALVGLAAGACGLLLALAAAWGVDLAAGRLLPEFPYKPASYFEFGLTLCLGAVLLSTVACALGALVAVVRVAARSPADLLTGRR